MHATAFLKDPDGHASGSLVVLSGEERMLKHSALRALSESLLGSVNDAAVSRFAGKDADLKTVRDELLTVSMWSDRRLVVVEDAADFVSENRAGLETYLKKPAKKSVLVLDVKSWPKNTRLAKIVAQQGLEIECTDLKGRELAQWLQAACRDQYGKQLSREAIQLLPELAGTNLGLLEQELAKLAAFVGDRKRIEVDDVHRLVGGWKAETTWVMLNALRDGDVGFALNNLEKLLLGGEAPQRILGAINFVFRKYAEATELSRRGGHLNAALKQAGVYPRDLDSSSRYLRRIGRPRAEKLYRWLQEADANMKGGSRLSERMQLEHLMLQLSGRA